MPEDGGVGVICWLIEREPVGEATMPSYWSTPLQAWARDPWFASRYPDAMVCERAILFLGLSSEGRAVEHAFGL